MGTDIKHDIVTSEGNGFKNQTSFFVNLCPNQTKSEMQEGILQNAETA